MSTTGNILIRKATETDCEGILKLVHELAVYERAPDEVTVTPEHFRESGFGEKPVWWAFVAEEEHQIIGFALYYIRFSTWKGQRMYLEDILVTEEHRGKGVGKMLMDRLITEAKEKQLHGISWQVLDWNEPAILFYNKYAARYDKEWWNARIDVG
ncbi:MAG TPA: GNAT family N-acetyltransferase [Flavipsychrobacter sp.]|nr:GNAT family N-acetyltransferase [Flavipsychrobacter sp.]